MIVEIDIVDGPIAAEKTHDYGGAGAVLTFCGVVRPVEDGRPLDALHYDTYEPMAQNMLRDVAKQVGEQHDVLAMFITHSRGRVGIGECSFAMTIVSKHRKESLSAMDAFIDRMKQDVPIWKRPVWQE
jgi:molybdopterin synthase catalytic subunit